jgi:4-hydroxy-tetrahydrodipicolinate synthase
MKKLYGVITAMTTPFDENDQVDAEALEQQTDFLIDKGVNCLYPCGTTGEMYLMSVEEREKIAETVVRRAAGKVTVYIHAGAMNLEDTVRLCKHAHSIGADGVGVVTPAYFGADDRAILQYYVDICAALPVDFPVYVYVIPQLAKNDVSLELMNEIAEACPQIIGVKYSYPDVRRICQYLTVRGGNFSVVVGADDLFFPCLMLGADGTVSGCSGPMPEAFVDVYNYYTQGRYEDARIAQLTATKHCEFLLYGGNMSIFKNLLTMRGIRGGHMRKPLLDLEPGELGVLKMKLENFLSMTK